MTTRWQTQRDIRGNYPPQVRNRHQVSERFRGNTELNPGLFPHPFAGVRGRYINRRLHVDDPRLFIARDHLGLAIYHERVFTLGSKSISETRSGFPMVTPSIKSSCTRPAALEHAEQAMTVPPSFINAMSMS